MGLVSEATDYYRELGIPRVFIFRQTIVLKSFLCHNTEPSHYEGSHDDHTSRVLCTVISGLLCELPWFFVQVYARLWLIPFLLLACVVCVRGREVMLMEMSSPSLRCLLVGLGLDGTTGILPRS